MLVEGQTKLPVYHFRKCHLVVDVKFEGFKFKSRMVAGGHTGRCASVPEVRIHDRSRLVNFQGGDHE